MSAPRLIYMDHNATTPLDARVLEAMTPYLTERFGNPASTSHVFGTLAAEAVEQGREKTARLICSSSAEIVFTSGATESDNAAIKGVAWEAAGKGRHIVTSAIEHRAVLESCRFLETQGYEVTYLPVDADGVVDPDDVRRALRAGTILVSVMHANSEIGSIQPVHEIGAICRERGVPFHVDATQTVGKMPVDVEAMGADLLAFSGHKIYGPKGIGGLHVRRRRRLVPLHSGGGQEKGQQQQDREGLHATVCITTRRSLPDSPPQVSPGRPSSWRTFAPDLSLGNALNFSVTGSKRTIALAPKSVAQTLSLSST